jgi:hypothetical protein
VANVGVWVDTFHMAHLSLGNRKVDRATISRAWPSASRLPAMAYRNVSAFLASDGAVD